MSTACAEAIVEVEVDGDGRVHIANRRHPVDVLFVHGWGASMHMWAFVAHLVEQAGFGCAAMDLRGHGASSAIPRGADLDLLIGDLAAALEALDGRDIIVVGHSIGGAVVQGLAVRRPDLLGERVAGLVLVNTTARGSASTPRARFISRLAGYRSVARLGTTRAAHVLARRCFRSAVPTSVLVAAREVFTGGRFDDRAGFDVRRSLSDLSARLNTVSVPVTVVASTHDPLTPLEESVVIADAVPGSRLRVLLRTGHVSPLERPAEVAEEILRMAVRRSSTCEPYRDRTRPSPSSMPQP